VAHRVLELIGSKPNVLMHDVATMTLGLAAELSGAEQVVFIDPSEELGDPWLEPASAADELRNIVDLARERFEFRGDAYVCHVPGLDFSKGVSLTAYAEDRARRAAKLVGRILEPQAA
jgi:hypothetical protein